ncbi:hypothetical protein PV08_03375 [Exophiala spinifera]|uniref:Uncharacterized protein n=1 Tax=Exophiala spinifera TaxID=91928 RepID=A0A0D2BJK3_9EURO|nr:uncharacterized protein PV08_03375 [Exophiala spinifera]KIW19083.1 hypothetical protein PV08_03375 [Exophiala spinifera]
MDWIQELRLGRVYAQPRAIDMADVTPLSFEACRYNGGRLLVPVHFLAPSAMTRADLALGASGLAVDNGYLVMTDYQRGWWDSETVHLVHKMANNVSLSLVARQHRITPRDVVVRIAQYTERRMFERGIATQNNNNNNNNNGSSGNNNLRLTSAEEVRVWLLGSMVWEVCEGVFPEVVAARYTFTVRDMIITIAQWALCLE